MIWNIIFILSGVATLLVGLKLGYKKQMEQTLLYLVVKAEQEFGSKTGRAKLSAVITALYDRLPSACRWLFTAKELEYLINVAVERMKLWLSTNDEANNIISGR